MTKEQCVSTDPLRRKNVWDLTLPEIEYLYSHLHMNSYVYAALKICGESHPPFGKKLKVKQDIVPDFMFDQLSTLTALSEYLADEEPNNVRVHCTYLAYRLMLSISKAAFNDLHSIIRILALTAFIPVLAEKYANFPLWRHRAIREPHPDHLRCYREINDSIDIDSYIRLPFFRDTISEEERIEPTEALFAFMPRAISAIITKIENEGNSEQISTAFMQVEKAMRTYELQHNLGCIGETPLNVQHSGQLRYRNTLYLYGGNHLERLGLYRNAFEWYVRDIYTLHLPTYSGFYLTDFKTCERLIRAFYIHPNERDSTLFHDLLDHMMFQAFLNSAEYAEKIVDYVDTNPEVDITKNRLSRKNGRPMLYSGEAMREIFLISLLYMYYVEKVDFEYMDYSSLFEIQ